MFGGRQRTFARILLLAIAWSCAASAAFANDLAERLEKLTPDYPAPPLEVLEPADAPAAAVALVGVSLEQNGARIAGDVPHIDSGAPLDVITYWRVRQRVTSAIPGELAFWDHLSLIRETQRTYPGPGQGEPAWEVGGVYTTRNRIDPAPIARQFSGDASLVVAIRGRSHDSKQPLPRQLLVVHVAPVSGPSPIALDEVQSELGEEVQFLADHIRLGLGAVAVIEVPEHSQGGHTRIAVISGTSYRGGKQGTPLCRMTLNPGTDAKADFTLKAGEHTSLRNIDAVPATAREHDMAPVFISRDSGQIGGDGSPIRFHYYIAEFEIPESAAAVNRIQFECLAPVILDVEGVVLLP
jgi:hypothetical protein